MSDGAAQRQALADKIRNEHAHSTRRRRVIAMVVVALGVLVCLGAMILLQLQASEAESEAEPNNVSDDFGFTLTPELATGEELDAESVPVAIYEDFLCDSCKVFHEQSSDFLAKQVAAGKISVTYHPFTFLLSQSTDEYSQRAANAAVCVADESGVNAYVKMHELLITHMPAQGGAGLSDEELIDFAEQAGADDAAGCVQERTFSDWVEQATEAGLNADVSSTPTIRVNGVNVVRTENGQESMPGPDELLFAIEAQ